MGRAAIGYADGFTLKARVEVFWDSNFINPENMLNAKDIAIGYVYEALLNECKNTVDLAVIQGFVKNWEEQASREIVQSEWPDQNWDNLPENEQPAVMIFFTLGIEEEAAD